MLLLVENPACFLCIAIDAEDLAEDTRRSLAATRRLAIPISHIIATRERHVLYRATLQRRRKRRRRCRCSAIQYWLGDDLPEHVDQLHGYIVLATTCYAAGFSN